MHADAAVVVVALRRGPMSGPTSTVNSISVSSVFAHTDSAKSTETISNQPGARSCNTICSSIYIRIVVALHSSKL